MDIEKGDVEAGGNVSSEDNPQSKGDAAADVGMNVEDFLLPRSITQRLAKGVLPPNTAIHRDAMLAITKAATVFVSYLSSHANEETNKKTITPQDVLAALSGIEFDHFRPRLERELAIYTEAAARKRRGKKGEKGPTTNIGGNIEGGGDEPENKRLKRDTGDQEEKDQDQDQKVGNSATATSNGDSKMSGGQDEIQRPKVGNQDGDDHSDSTDVMEDTNIIDDEEESHDEGEKEEDEEEEEEDEEEEDKVSSQEIDIESDASRKRNRRQGRSDLDSNSGSESDDF